MRRAVEDADIRSIHPEKLEEWAEYLVRKLKKQYSKGVITGSNEVSVYH